MDDLVRPRTPVLVGFDHETLPRSGDYREHDQPAKEVDVSDRTCSVEDCDEPSRARGWCRKHYLRWYKYGDVEIVKPGGAVLTHGYSRVGNGNGTPAYMSWVSMRQRVNDPNHPHYADYGGRGITIDSRWDDFEVFLVDVGECPPDPPDWKGRRRYYSLDRIDNDGNYEPENVRWATAKEQANNRREAREAAIGDKLLSDYPKEAENG